MKRVTIQDVADRVGVTKGLVSRALRGKYNVSEKMREEITRTAVAMGYDFGKLRAKNKRRSKCLLIMTSDMLLKKDYWQPIIRTLTATLDERHINLEYLIYDEFSCGAADVAKLKAVEASGYVFMNNNPEVLVRAAENTNLPVVVIDPKIVLSGRHLQIKYSNFNSFYDLTRLLIRAGHRHFMFYGPKAESASFAEREQGFLACVADNVDQGVTYAEVLFDNKSGQYADNVGFKKALTDNADVTAILCANDIIAINAIKSINAIGKRVPEDYAVVGFDNIAESGAERINLTTVNVPREELGAEAARYLINHINNKQIKYSQLVIDCETVIRRSIGDLKKEN
ncbi:MAG: LacI family DNA-binding transcriptional regulator [Clostridia bacterium]|nr:LacI family DNA-binding transcriptional regulator [Clostridia bacterium]